MERRSFLRTAAVGAGAAAAGSLAAPAVAQDAKVVKMVTTWPRNFPGLGTGAQRVADRITAASGGRITVKLFAAGELVPAFESFDAVSSGAAEMYHGAEYYWQGKHAAYPFFSTVPLGLTSQELEAWVRYGGGQELWDELSAGFNVKGIMAGNTGVQMGGWFRDPIASLDDLKGLKIRTPGLGAEVYRRVGATAISLPGGEIFPALQAGTIDAADWVGPYNDLAFGFHKVLKNYMYPGFQEPGPAVALGVNKSWWDGRDDADRALIESCCLTETVVMLAEFNARNGESLAELVNEHGVKLHRFPEEVLNELGKVSDEVVAETANVDDLGKRIFESYRDFRKNVVDWSKLSEQAYLNARAAALGV